MDGGLNQYLDSGLGIVEGHHRLLFLVADIGLGYALHLTQRHFHCDRAHGAVHGGQIQSYGLRFGPDRQACYEQHESEQDFYVSPVLALIRCADQPAAV